MIAFLSGAWPEPLKAVPSRVLNLKAKFAKVRETADRR